MHTRTSVDGGKTIIKRSTSEETGEETKEVALAIGK